METSAIHGNVMEPFTRWQSFGVSVYIFGNMSRFQPSRWAMRRRGLEYSSVVISMGGKGLLR